MILGTAIETGSDAAIAKILGTEIETGSGVVIAKILGIVIDFGFDAVLEICLRHRCIQAPRI